MQKRQNMFGPSDWLSAEDFTKEVSIQKRVFRLKMVFEEKLRRLIGYNGVEKNRIKLKTFEDFWVFMQYRYAEDKLSEESFAKSLTYAKYYEWILNKVEDELNLSNEYFNDLVLMPTNFLNFEPREESINTGTEEANAEGSLIMTEKLLQKLKACKVGDPIPISFVFKRREQE